MSEDAAAQRPMERAWTILDQVIERSQVNPVHTIDLDLPQDPEQAGLIVAALANVAWASISALADAMHEDASAVAASLKHLTSNQPDPTIGVSPEERRIADHYGPEGPVAAAFGFLRCVVDTAAAAFWALMSDDLKLYRVEWWLWNNRVVLGIGDEKPTAMIDDFLSSVPAQPVWPRFLQSELAQAHDAWNHWLELIPQDRLGAASAPRLIAPDLEIVLLTETDPSGRVYTEPTAVEALNFVMRRTDAGWRVAAYGDTPHTPSWPPVTM